MTTRRREFLSALEAHAPSFGVRAGESLLARLGDYFQLVERWNARLHLVAPCTPAEFAVRHALESLFAARHIPESATVVDVGSGAGLPVIPCLLARADLRGILVEASAKKCVFLGEAVAALDLRQSAEVVNARFEDVEPPAAQVLTCRALERFAETLPRLVAWSPRGCQLILFGGTVLRDSLRRAGQPFTPLLIPESEQRFLFIVERA